MCSVRHYTKLILRHTKLFSHVTRYFKEIYMNMINLNDYIRHCMIFNVQGCTYSSLTFILVLPLGRSLPPLLSAMADCG